MVTFKEYKEAILTKYEKDKYVQLLEILHPSPAKLKLWSLHLLDSLNDDDKKIYERFYTTDCLTAKKIEVFENDKFRPIKNFLERKSDLTNPLSIELLAILIDVKPRPFEKFRKEENHIISSIDNVIIAAGEVGDADYLDAAATQGHTVAQEEITLKEVMTNNGKEDSHNSHFRSNYEMEQNESSSQVATFPPKKILFGASQTNIWSNAIKLLGIVGIAILAGMIISKVYFNENECMVWKDDHYETTPCSSEVQSLINTSVIVSNKELIKYQKKIQVCDTTTFFNPDGTPRVWYGKVANKKYEFFTYPGIHPLTGKTLKHITPYIIKKYVKVRKSN